MVTSEQIWQRVKKRIQSKMAPGEFHIWFSKASLKRLESGTAVISVPNRFYAMWLSEKYLPAIEEGFSKFVKGSPRVSFYYEGTQDTGEDQTDVSSNLDPAMSFEEMQTGDWNRFARSSALQMTGRESMAFNPLFVYGRAGLGKTHLLHAIGNRIRSDASHLGVKYVHSMVFASEFSLYSGKDQSHSFEETCSFLDVMLFDDVHLLAEHPEVQKGLVSIFDALYSHGKRMVFSADRPIHELSGIINPLKSRLAWGVLSEIRLPDQNALVQIIRRKGREGGVHLPEDVVFFLAHAGRDLKGLSKNILKLKNYSSLNGGQINISLAMSLIKGSDQTKIGIEDIKTVTAGYFNIPIHELTSGGKKRSQSYPRQVAMYLARKYTDLSFKEIGSSFGHKDHSTVIHAIRRIEEQREQGRSTSDDLTRIENLIS